MKDYVEEHGDGYRVAGTRVSLDSIVYAFQSRQSPETIVHSFPSLQLEQVYGAITDYLGHRAEVEAFLATEREADPAVFKHVASFRRSGSEGLRCCRNVSPNPAPHAG